MDKATYERLLTEYKEVSERATKLQEFIKGEMKDAPIDNLNKDLLVSQLKAMETYICILSIRINLNTPKEEVIGTDNLEEVKENTTVNE